MSETRTDYCDLPAWCQPETIQQRPAAHCGAALASGEVLLCNRCHLPRRDLRNGRLLVMVEQHELVFVPERYCECEDR